MITLRPYQQAAADKLVGILKARRIAYLRGAVRTGKTLTAMEAIRQLGVERVLVLTKKKAIKSIEADRDAYGLTDRVTVTNFEQAGKLAKSSWGLVVVDEAHACFVGSTLVDGVKIKDIKVGHILNTVNFASNRIEKSRVVQVIANPLTERLVKITADGKEVVCTESHQVFTRGGWKRAGDITAEDEVCTRWVRDNASPEPGV